ncbi:DedA family protein [Sulfuricurvum sp.]|uniref:DedA family protein n=1 Tax=Sulfuricurvum sp. TaxID=2025608 RepID=UPI00199E86B2|nr:DedA family protein [Sulfuricurvum sp.]MBD3799373.1 DedA family protein [Campylobacterota bacterium]MBD3806306.1 DedA family protein [Sulfuricurvum sp.]
MDEMLTNLSTYGYITLFLYSLGGGFVALLGAGVLSFMGKMDLSLSITIAMVANFIGDSLMFYMSRYHKREMMEYFKKHRRKLAFSHLLLKKHGSWIIIVKKFIYGLKTLVPLAIGLTKYDFWKFSTYNAIGAAIWAIVVGGLSFLFGGALIEGYKMVAEKPYLAPIMLILIVGSVWLYLSSATKKR